MKHEEIQRSFERFLRSRGLKLTAQRQRILERAFATHEHFSAETLYRWMREEEGPKVSRAKVYGTRRVLLEGGSRGSLDTRRGELMYEAGLDRPGTMAAILGLSGDEVVHCLLDVMYAEAPYTTISRAVHIHPTVSELVPTVLQSLRPLDDESAG